MLYYSKDGEKYDGTENQVRRCMTSTVIFIIAFIVTQSVYQILSGIIAQSLGYSSPLNFSEILLTQDYHAWNIKRIIVVCLVPITIFLGLSILIFSMLNRDKSRLDGFWLFSFWVMV